MPVCLDLSGNVLQPLGTGQLGLVIFSPTPSHVIHSGAMVHVVPVKCGQTYRVNRGCGAELFGRTLRKHKRDILEIFCCA
ncbi:hypothetical protein ONE63_001686 [Megalurothrips usitatus]|uniref:Uncharacterized protein n=1 Tax=Megalurothrips usitatus TaxID=439358 RepID=A0AAV7XDG0_9NEOP|nr:hypothetical protein ONE63_001686 [Megalurothrips usitatus]